ncbi:fumarylacetoacetate hydrolase family protein [Rhodococcus globerulus]|uniref:fumarylacetoacetate hydrolase family protein n=1 Tax=Rhodococcus globerulus TaxID=33008 RepID=UPI000A4E529D|nr:fumarylacetoacetate hydrolase family protein [Rhodococcus globerulus]
MRLASVFHLGERRAAIIEGDRAFVTVIPGLDAALDYGSDLRRSRGMWMQVDQLQLDAPVRPPVIFCIGQNYQDHVDEKQLDDLTSSDKSTVYPHPEFFLKAGQTLTRPTDPCVLDPAITAKLDYETELGVIIGRTAHRVSPTVALDYVHSYVVANEMGARDRQLFRNSRGGFDLKLGPGKNFDGAMRMAGTIVTADQLSNPEDLELETRVNGVLRQRANTADLIFGIPEIIAYLSSFLTLTPGSLIVTGAPGGTAWASDAEAGGTGLIPAGCRPGPYLAVGDRLDSRIHQVGELGFDVVEVSRACTSSSINS